MNEQTPHPGQPLQEAASAAPLADDANAIRFVEVLEVCLLNKVQSPGAQEGSAPREELLQATPMPRIPGSNIRIARFDNFVSRKIRAGVAPAVDSSEYGRWLLGELERVSSGQVAALSAPTAPGEFLD